MDLSLSDEFLATIVPVMVYWLYSGIYQVLLGCLENYRLHSKREEDMKNLVSKSNVIKGVLLQQAIQMVVAVLSLTIISSSNGETTDDLQPSILLLLSQILIAVLVLDAWQYFIHRYMHRNKFLFRKVHSQHHRLVVPYAFGALYNHPFEALLDTIGGALSFLLSGMSPRTSIFFFSLATLKTVDDHCGLWLPGNPFQMFFSNNAAYHDVHHQVNGNKYNFSQTFFVMWDKIMGTYMAYALEKRTDGGFEVRPVKD